MRPQPIKVTFVTTHGDDGNLVLAMTTTLRTPVIDNASEHLESRRSKESILY